MADTRYVEATRARIARLMDPKLSPQGRVAAALEWSEGQQVHPAKASAAETLREQFTNDACKALERGDYVQLSAIIQKFYTDFSYTGLNMPPPVETVVTQRERFTIYLQNLWGPNAGFEVDCAFKLFKSSEKIVSYDWRGVTLQDTAGNRRTLSREQIREDSKPGFSKTSPGWSERKWQRQFPPIVDPATRPAEGPGRIGGEFLKED